MNNCSGAEVDWLAALPSRWRALSLKYLASWNDEVLSEAHPKNREILYVDIGSVSSNGDIVSAELMQFSEAPSRARRVVREGDVLVSTVRTYLKAIAAARNPPENLIASTGFAVIRGGADAVPNFLAYALRAEGFIGEVISRSVGVSYPAINAGDLLNINIPAPPVSEQSQIAKFLDYETAKIDALIEKQQQLIELLKEKRQAVISHAVTKGLNPDAPMRDSGIEWLGEVPAHWEVSKFGYVSSVVRGGSPRPAGDPSLFDGDYSPWVTVAEITKDDEITLTKTATFLTKKGSNQCRVFKSGTLLLSNSGATLGVPKILMIDANANDGVVGFEELRHHREYCYHYLSSITEDLRERIKQGSGQPNLNTDIIKGLAVPVPPKREVEAIAHYIEMQSKKFMQLTEKAGLGIELLRERKTALISAAITGKIDVRGWKAPESETEVA